MAAPFYGVGLVMTLGYVVGMQSNLAAGGAMLLVAIAMFVLGHKIEGNLRSMAPVLLFRLLVVIVLLSRRKVARYPFAKRVHLLRT
jgi:hypothetical protein